MRLTIGAGIVVVGLYNPLLPCPETLCYYNYWIWPEDCVIISNDTGRCLVYIYEQIPNDYNFNGGYERYISARYHLVTRVGPGDYREQTVFTDFLMYICSDVPRTNLPLCSPNGPR